MYMYINNTRGQQKSVSFMSIPKYVYISNNVEIAVDRDEFEPYQRQKEYIF